MSQITINTELEDQKIVTIKKGEEDFFGNTKMIIFPRAQLKIHNDCPPEIRHVLQVAMINGWIEESVQFTTKEYLMLKMCK